MKRPRHIGTVFWFMLLIVWLPWLIWYAIDTYALGNEDMKFGRDGGFIFSVIISAYIAIASSISGAVIRFLDSVLFLPITVRQTRFAAIGAGLSLSALSPFIFRFYIPWFGEVTGLVVGWMAISTAVCVIWFSAVRTIAPQQGSEGGPR